MSAITWTSCPPRRRPVSRPVNRPVSRTVSGPVSGPVRLTRRGRALVVVVLLAVALGALVLVTAPATATGDPGVSAVADRVTVRPGETLWSIAERVRPEADPRATIARIRDMNGLESSVAQAGQVLLVPAAG